MAYDLKLQKVARAIHFEAKCCSYFEMYVNVTYVVLLRLCGNLMVSLTTYILIPVIKNVVIVHLYSKEFHWSLSVWLHEDLGSDF